MKPASQTLTAFVLDRVDSVPLTTQIELYEAMAQFAATPKEARAFRDIAADLSHAQAKHQQLVLDFRRRAEG